MKVLSRIFKKKLLCNHKRYIERWAFQQQTMRECLDCDEYELADCNNKYHKII